MSKLKQADSDEKSKSYVDLDEEKGIERIQKSFTGSKKKPAYLDLTKRAALDKNILIESFNMFSEDGHTELITEAQLQFVYGRKYGFMGKNGSGKSTLLRRISEYSLAGFPKHLRVVMVQQDEIVNDSALALQYVVASDEEKNWLEYEEERLLDLLATGGEDENGVSLMKEEDGQFDPQVIQEQIDRIGERLDEIDARKAELRAKLILTGLGFSEKSLNSKISDLSGGWRKRVALACALFVHPDVLLLDEPTNHLDFSAVFWLQEYLKNVPHTVIIVSHDRDFLNNVMTDAIELIDRKLDYYRGNYESYLHARAQFLATQRTKYEAQQRKIKETKLFIEENKLSDNPDKAKMASQRQKLLEQLIAECPEPPHEEKNFSFKFPEPGKLDHDLLECTHMYFSYNVNEEDVWNQENGQKEENNDDDDEEDDEDDEEDEKEKKKIKKLEQEKKKSESEERLKQLKYILKDVNVNLSVDSRVGILGVNGCGKTTLIKLIMQTLKPTKGICRLNPHARAVLFTQHHYDQLDPSLSSLQYLQKKFPKAKEHEIRGIMGKFGFDSNLITHKIGTLSGGQKSRVAFAILTWQNPHLIIMDEPTNHLDIETIESLVEALKAFQGGVVIVSHDHYFVKRTCETFWALDGTGSVEIEYNFEDAKEKCYPPINFNPEAVNSKLSKSMKDDSNSKDGSSSNSSSGSSASRRNKKKSKKGAGGINVYAIEQKKEELKKKEEEEKWKAAEEKRLKAIEEEEQRRIQQFQQKINEKKELIEKLKNEGKIDEADALAQQLQKLTINEQNTHAMEVEKTDTTKQETAQKASKKEKEEEEAGEEEEEEETSKQKKKEKKEKKSKKESAAGKKKQKGGTVNLFDLLEDEPVEEDEPVIEEEEEIVQKKKKKKKEDGVEKDEKKKKKKKTEQSEEMAEEDENESPKSPKDKKKKKKKDEIESETPEISTDAEKKKKKKKKDEEVESENVDTEKKKKKKKDKEDTVEEDATDMKEEKKKKKKEKEDNVEEDVSEKKKKKKKIISEEDSTETVPEEKKKKKKAAVSLEDEKEEEANDREVVKEKKEKKKKPKDAIEEEDGDEDKSEKKEKKKKKKIEEEDNAADEDNTAEEKKKKKKKTEKTETDGADAEDKKKDKKEKKKKKAAEED